MTELQNDYKLLNTEKISRFICQRIIYLVISLPNKTTYRDASMRNEGVAKQCTTKREILSWMMRHIA